MFPLKRSRWLAQWTRFLSHLCFSQHEWGGHFEAFGSGQVLVEFELVLQLQQLLAGEGGARPPALPQQTRLRARWRRSRRVISLWLRGLTTCFLFDTGQQILVKSLVRFFCVWRFYPQHIIIQVILKHVAIREDSDLEWVWNIWPITATVVLFIIYQGHRKFSVMLWVGTGTHMPALCGHH